MNHEPFISFETGKCPVCRKRLENASKVLCGHLLMDNEGEEISVTFAACEEHRQQAETMAVITEECRNRKGCVGMWDMRFGLLVNLDFPNISRDVRLI